MKIISFTLWLLLFLYVPSVCLALFAQNRTIVLLLRSFVYLTVLNNFYRSFAQNRAGQAHETQYLLTW